MRLFAARLPIMPIFACALALLATTAMPGSAAGGPFFGFTPFPYDFTAEAVEKTRQIITPNSGLYALHLDDGIPWKEAMANRGFPARVQNEWDNWASVIPSGHAVYVGLAPLAKDRKSLAPARGERDGEPMPVEIKGVRLDDNRVKRAYLNYARRAVIQFKPDFLNLGIEAGELAARDPSRWPEFVSLYEYVASSLKREFPQMKVGISFGLQSLRKPSMARLAKPVIDQSDYLCLSFYPYTSPFGERFGEPALPAGKDAWREPLDWVKGFSSKPIAVCETGFSSQDVNIRSFDLEFRGNPETQAAYVRDLLQTAKRDGYLFVVWFLAIDYDKLYAKMPKGSEINLMWRNIGLFDGELRAKPAWNEWKNAVGANHAATPLASKAQPTNNSIQPLTAKKTSALKKIGFDSANELFACIPGSSVALEPASGPPPNDPAMRWSYQYSRGEWAWCTKKFDHGRLAGSSRLHLWIKSDRTGQLFLQLEEEGGEAFVAVIEVDTTWQQVTLPLSGLSVDPAKKKNGRLEPEKINSILVADAGARSGATGKRTVWFSSWSFE